MPDTQKRYRPILADLSDAQAAQLCDELRAELIQDVAQTGGHLASNLGSVELTVAIHRVFDTSVDRLVFDVGHQCYTHKMLTGRREEMSSLRQFGGISGFPKPSESVHDAFIAGHASNSVAVAVGMARARTLLGDGALTGGLAYEGLSNAGQSGEPMIVILNDNGMSITKNVGGVAEHLARQRLKPQYLTFKKGYRKVMGLTWIGRKVYRFTHRLKKAFKQTILPSSMFEDMGFYYMGPVDGHDVAELTKLLRYAKDLNEPVLLHVRTIKGKGFTPAQTNPDVFHGVGPYDPDTGALKKPAGDSFSSVFGAELVRLAREDRRVCALTAAMLTGTGLEGFKREFPKRCFDVGIAEGCAVSMAAGLAKQGMIPVFAVYSTFLQRSYDMLLHDVALGGLHVVFAVDRAGLVGEDGETHQGVFDPAFFDTVPGMTVLAPASFAELRSMLRTAVLDIPGPVAIRYPRGGEGEFTADCSGAPAAVLREGTDLTLVSYGAMTTQAVRAAEILAGRGVSAEVVKLNTITPLPEQIALASVRKTGALLTAEDTIASNSVGRRLAACLGREGIRAKVALCSTGDTFTTHGSVPKLRELLGLDAESLADRAMEVLGRG